MKSGAYTGRRSGDHLDFFKGLKVHQIIANSFFYLLVVDVGGGGFHNKVL